MGKKAAYKKIRRMAQQLPTIMRRTSEKHIVSGKELLKDEVKEVAGKPVEADANYVQHYPVLIAVNHNRAMKKMYNQHGAPGLVAYVNAVKRNKSVPKTQTK